jgi:hypothetical protein
MDAFLIAWLVVTIAAMVVTVLKGKWGMFAVGWLIGLCWYIGAIRIAKPNSWWDRRFYKPGTDKWTVARARRGQVTVLPPAAVPAQPMLDQAPPKQPAVSA